jgi:phosphoribosylamine--glycine ligase
MTHSPEEDVLKSDGTRVAWLNVNASLKAGQSRGEVAERSRNKLLAASDNRKIRIIPREDPRGNRLAMRRDIGYHYLKAEKIFQDS